MIQKKRKGRPKKTEAVKPVIPINEEILVKFGLTKKDLSKIDNLKNYTAKPKIKKSSEKIKQNNIDLEKKNEEIEKIKNDINLLSEKIDKYIGKKANFVELKSAIIHKDGNISAIEKNNELVCFYCTYPFSNDPCFIPEKYDKVNKRYHVFGNFCSFSCASRYNISLGDFNMWNRNSLLTSLFRDSLKNAGLIYDSEIKIPDSPSRESLIKFGGRMTIEEFRDQSCKGDIIYQYIYPCMEMKKSYIEELHKKPEIFDSLEEIKNHLNLLIKNSDNKIKNKF